MATVTVEFCGGWAFDTEAVHDAAAPAGAAETNIIGTAAPAAKPRATRARTRATYPVAVSPDQREGERQMTRS
jgi:hypothetical protein